MMICLYTIARIWRMMEMKKLSTVVTVEWFEMLYSSILMMGKYRSRKAMIRNPNPIAVVLTLTTVLVTED